MARMQIELMGVEELQKELDRLYEFDLKKVNQRHLKEIFNRGKDNTPVGNYKGGGQLRKSLTMAKDEVGYTKEYAPHVEYGHRTVNGGFVQGQLFFKNNVDEQRELYHKDLKRLLKNERGEL